MSHERRDRREQAAADRAATEAALQPVACGACGRTFEGQAAQVIGHEQGRCLPDGAYGQLVKLKNGQWGQRWRHPDL